MASIIERFFYRERKVDNFAARKKEATDFLQGKIRKKYESPLDDNIRQLVTKMNQLSFLYTTQSCGGHVATRDSIIARYPEDKLKDVFLPPENRARYYAGGIQFRTNGDDHSREFINKLKGLVAQFEDVILFDPTAENNPERQKIPFILEFGENSGKGRTIDIQLAKDREAKREEFKLELQKLTDEFLQKQEA